MSIIIGIDVGFGSHVVSKLVTSSENSSDAVPEIQLNMSKGNEFKCQLECSEFILGIADQANAIVDFLYDFNDKNCTTVATFTVDYLRDNLNAEGEKNFNGVSIVKKNSQVYLIFKTKDWSSELCIPATYGFLFLYEYFCVLNTSELPYDYLLDHMASPSIAETLQQTQSILAVPTSFEVSDISRLKTIFGSFGLPPASFVHRSIPTIISACYNLWKDAYEKDKMMKKNYVVIDLGYTCSNIYLVGITRHHLKVKCHLHSVEANARSLEFALAEAIRKSNADHKKLFKNAANFIKAQELAKKHLPSFFSAKTETIHVMEADLFVSDGTAVAFDEKISRKNFLKECNKVNILDAYNEFISSFIAILKEYKLSVDRIIPIGQIVALEEIKNHILKAFTSVSSDKRINSPANKIDCVSQGAVSLVQLIQQGKVALDPAFVNIVFWPTPALEQANQTTWDIPGMLKITHTRSDLKMDATDLDSGTCEAMTAELSSIIVMARQQEAMRALMHQQRQQLIAEYTRVAGNQQRVHSALLARDASAPTESVAPAEPAERETEAAPVMKTKSDEMRALESEEGELEEIIALVNSDKHLTESTENSKQLLQRLVVCDEHIHLLAATFPELILEDPVVEESVSAVPQVAAIKKKRGCCKGKSDVVTMGSA